MVKKEKEKEAPLELDGNYNSGTLVDLFGIDTQFLLAHIPYLVSGDIRGAVAFEGSSGTGKTTLLKRLGLLNEKATGGSVKIFSADKARYEDFNGCPIPDSVTHSMIIYPMPNSVAQQETVIIDEATRAGFDNQEKWLSLIASGEIDGLPTKCKHLYLAFNPVMSESNSSHDTYEGVQPLDKAFGERIMALVRMPSFSSLPSSIRRQIIRGTFGSANWEPTAERVSMFSAFITKARSIYETLKASNRANVIIGYIDELHELLSKETKGALTFEARRANFMFHNILAIHSLREAISERTSVFKDNVLEAVMVSFPNTTWEQEVNYVAIKAAHQKLESILSKASIEEKDETPLGSLKQLNRQVKEIMGKVKDADVNKETLSKQLYALIVPVATGKVQSESFYLNNLALHNGLKTLEEIHQEKPLKAQERKELTDIYDSYCKSASWVEDLTNRLDLANPLEIVEQLPVLKDLLDLSPDSPEMEHFQTFAFAIEAQNLITFLEESKIKVDSFKEMVDYLEELVNVRNTFVGTYN